MKKALRSFVIFFVMLFLTAFPVFATADAPYIEFTNKHVTGSLTIIKTIKDYDMSYMPDEDFQFVLKIDGTPYASQEYSLMGDYNGARNDLGTQTTNGGGEFVLKVNQAATFNDIPIDSEWYVEENLQPGSRYQISVPVGANHISGTISTGDTAFAFINEYVPAHSLRIYKDIYMPDSLETPETPEFTFQLSIDGAQYANMEYNVLDESKGLIETKSTDGEGKFTLKGKQYAEFGGLLPTQTYVVKELPGDSKWISFDSGGFSGLLSASSDPVTDVTFTNMLRYIEVVKTMSDGSKPAVDFNFTISPASGAAVDLGYYLYDTDAKTLLQPDEITISGSDPTFKLQPGQTALISIPESQRSVSFHIQEKHTSGYTCVYPAGALGYSVFPHENKSALSCTFKNSVSEFGSITVTKEGNIPGITDVPESPDFTFTLTVEGALYKNKDYTVYSTKDGSTVASRTTDGNGNFTLKCGQKAVFSDVEAGLEYTVTEKPDDSGWFEVTDSRKNDTGTTSASGVNAEFYNRFLTFGINKRMDDNSNDSADFPFVVSLPDGSPLKNTTYYTYDENDKLISSGTTDMNGRLTLKANQTVFLFLTGSESEYIVKELVLPGYKKVSPSEDEHHTHLSSGTVSVIQYVNKIQPSGITFIKHDAGGTPLSGAKFKLRKEDGTFAVLSETGSNDWAVQSWDASGTEITSPADGTFKIQGFETGSYALVETAAPAGYLPAPEILFTVSPDADGMLEAVPADSARSDAVFAGKMSEENCTLTITDSKSTRIVVEKEILMPINGSVLPPETPEFTFQLTVDGELYADKEFTITDISGTEMGTGHTDGEGKFSIPSNRKAVFKDIRSGAEYSVKEMPGDSYWIFLNDLYAQGVTDDDGVEAYIRNTVRCAVVEKQMDDSSTPNTDFTFVLSDSAGSPMPSVKYYLFDIASNKYLFDSQHETDSNGQFTLKAGQAACLAFPEVTEYTVQELPAKGYNTVSPAGAEVSGTASDDTSYKHHIFVNEISNAVTFINVNDVGTPFAGSRFKISRSDGMYAVLTEENGVFKITGWNAAGTIIITDAAGMFKIEGFEQGSYTVTQTETPSGYHDLPPVLFDVNIDGSTGRLEPKLTDPSRNDVTLTGTMKDGDCTMTLMNKKNLILHFDVPFTGGWGNLIPIVFAGILLTGLILFFVRDKRKKE